VQLFEEVRATSDAAEHRLHSAVTRSNLGRAAARAGRFQEANELLTEARDDFREIHAASFEQEAHARLAESAVFAGDHARALVEIEFAELAGEANAPPQIQALLDRLHGYAHLQMHRPDEAVRGFDRSLASARDVGALYEIALTLRARALVRHDEADAA